jgi:Protein of unknown function (DUF1598)
VVDDFKNRPTLNIMKLEIIPMRRRTFYRRAGLLLAVIAAVSLLQSRAFTQTSTGTSGTSTSGSNNSTTNNNFNQSGVVVDAAGVLRAKAFPDPSGQLTRERIAAAKTELDPKVTASSKLRKISLNRLEAAIRQRQGVLSDEMRSLAGLQRIRYVFYYPDTKDIVLAGPAEGWFTNVSGHIVGINTGRPVVQLQDLVVGLRSFPPKGKSASLIGCSIDPTPEGLAAMQQFLRSTGSVLNPAQTSAASIIQGLKTSLGMHTISVNGVSPKTRFAQVMVEADYRMKLIGIGLERPPVRLISYVDRATAGDISRNALQRWFFTPDYQCVRVSGDSLAMELVGDGVKLVGENELISSTGQRQVSGVNKASQAFVNGFTKVYPELADRAAVYADLRNLIDIAIASAYIQQQEYYAKAGWKMEFFGDESAFPVETYDIPKTVESTVNAVFKNNKLLTPIGGGVQIQPTKALEADQLLSDEKGKVAKLREETTINLPKGQWWWD